MRIRVRGSYQPAPPGQTLFVGLLFTLVGCAIVLYSFNRAYQTYTLTSAAIKAQGVVVRYATQTGQKGTTYRAVVQFTTQSGQVQQITDGVGASTPRYQLGDRVDILYPARHPEQAQVNDFLSLWFLPFIGSAFGWLAVILGVALVSTGWIKWSQPSICQAN